MTLEVRIFPCLNDNYGLLVRDGATGTVAAIDTPDAQAILDDLERSGWPDVLFAYHDDVEIGPVALRKIAEKTGLRPTDL